MSWGLGLWGLGPWGLAAMALATARPIDTHTIYVTLSSAAQVTAPYNVGDALNPDTWVITDTDSGLVYTVLLIEAVSAGHDSFYIHVLEPLGPFQHNHTVNASTLLDSNGAPIVAPTELDFFGVVETENANQAITAPLVDLENNNTYRITSAGDYAEQSRGTIVRKIIQRRLATNPGGFFYLTDFGLGVNIKEPVTVPGLLALKAQIELQVLAEPEVEAVTAALTLDVRGYVYGVLRVKLRAGTDVEEVPVSSSLQF